MKESSKAEDCYSNFLHFWAIVFMHWVSMSIVFYVAGAMLCLFGLISGQISSGGFPDWNSLFFQRYPQTIILFTSLVIGYILWQANKNTYAKEGITRIPFNTNQAVVLKLELPFDKAFELCGSSIKKIYPLCWLQKSDVDKGIIQYIVKSKRMDRGILITFTLLKEELGTQIVTLSSKARAVLPLVDNAIQAQRIKSIMGFIEQQQRKG